MENRDTARTDIVSADTVDTTSAPTTIPGREWEEQNYPDYPEATHTWLYTNRDVVRRFIEKIPAPVVKTVAEFSQETGNHTVMSKKR